MKAMRAVALAADHAGFMQKARLIEHIRQQGLFEVVDFGTDTEDSTDYPDFAKKLAVWVVQEPERQGILICGTGNGMAMVANKHRGIRAAVCRSEYEARLARQHNDANVLCLGQRLTGDGLAVAIVDVFLHNVFEGGRHRLRLSKIRNMEDCP
ncbi:MAG: ribose 5-phosphate isomerase B [Proteobacteria bacterium]|nr:ribose 5-phosphate isomerase B [Cystobacterineae bacterium]MCL2258304.1 ribose 5-phosphate isomerase B [Cystobacterineae bacterium]MCL2315078.1 ribose 5-phosphate isomerase B [Pseudomonadota bacterium]